MKRLILLISAICIGISFMGCTKKSGSQIPIEKTSLKGSNLVNAKIENTEEFIKSLEKSGYKPKTTKQENSKFQDNGRYLSGTLTIINIDEDTIGVYEYKNNEEMEQGAKSISSDGSKIGGTIYEFKSKPHFYKNENVIVSYFGDNKETIKKIEGLMGKQFAGMM